MSPREPLMIDIHTSARNCAGEICEPSSPTFASTQFQTSRSGPAHFFKRATPLPTNSSLPFTGASGCVTWLFNDEISLMALEGLKCELGFRLNTADHN